MSIEHGCSLSADIFIKQILHKLINDIRMICLIDKFLKNGHHDHLVIRRLRPIYQKLFKAVAPTLWSELSDNKLDMFEHHVLDLRHLCSEQRQKR